MEDLPPTIVKSGPPEPDPECALSLVGNRTGGRGYRDHHMDGLTFIDYAAEGINETIRFEEQPSNQVTGVSLILPDPSVELEAASVTTEGCRDKAVLDVGVRASTTPAKPPEDPAALFERTRAAFQELVHYVHTQPHPAGWSAEIVMHNSPDRFAIGGAWPRDFLVLELRIAEQYTYVVDSLRKPEDIEFSLCMVRRVHRSQIAPQELARWLSRFPYEGREPWGDSEQTPSWLLRPLAIRHQPTKLPASIGVLFGDERMGRAEAHLVDGLWKRILRHVTQFEERLAKGLASVRRMEAMRRIT